MSRPTSTHINQEVSPALTSLFDTVLLDSGLLWSVDATSGMRHGPVRFPDGNPPPPHGCRWCGRPTYQHGARDWMAAAGQHGWTRPTPAQTVARMKARRAARTEARRLAPILTAFERGADLVGPAERRRRRHVEEAPEPAPVVRPRVCDQMNHNSVGTEVFCEIEDPDHTEDHDAGDGITWARED